MREVATFIRDDLSLHVASTVVIRVQFVPCTLQSVLGCVYCQILSSDTLGLTLIILVWHVVWYYGLQCTKLSYQAKLISYHVKTVHAFIMITLMDTLLAL